MPASFQHVLILREVAVMWNKREMAGCERRSVQYCLDIFYPNSALDFLSLCCPTTTRERDIKSTVDHRTKSSSRKCRSLGNRASTRGLVVRGTSNFDAPLTHSPLDSMWLTSSWWAGVNCGCNVGPESSVSSLECHFDCPFIVL